MIRWASGSLCVVGLLACTGGSETGNPAVPTPIGLGLRSSDPDLVAVSSGTRGTVIDEAWVAFGPFAFLPDSACAQLDDFQHVDPTLIAADLAAPDVRIEVELELGAYCGLVVPLEAMTSELPPGAPQALRDHSVVLRGKRADGVPFVLAQPEEDELELLAADQRISVTPDAPPWLLTFDVAQWLDGIDLDQAQLDADGTIYIDATSNPGLLLVFESHLECSLALHEDSNADGKLDAGERELAHCSPN